MEKYRVCICFTDGIGLATDTQLSLNKPGAVEMIKKNIPRIPQEKQDDKTLIILERIANK